MFHVHQATLKRPFLDGVRFLENVFSVRNLVSNAASAIRLRPMTRIKLITVISKHYQVSQLSLILLMILQHFSVLNVIKQLTGHCTLMILLPLNRLYQIQMEW